MAEDEEERKKSKRGRPSQGGPGKQVRISASDLAKVDAYAAANGCSRQEALSALIARGELAGD
jgi:hypothetical protein